MPRVCYNLYLVHLFIFFPFFKYCYDFNVHCYNFPLTPGNTTSIQLYFMLSFISPITYTLLKAPLSSHVFNHMTCIFPFYISCTFNILWLSRIFMPFLLYQLQTFHGQCSIHLTYFYFDMECSLTFHNYSFADSSAYSLYYI